MQKKRILICPLDWGLGHAARCIPIVNELLKQGVEVVIASDKHPLALLKLEFPQLEFIVYKGYDITYPSNGKMALSMLFQLPKIFKGIKKEHTELAKIIREYNIDAVISDNRFGAWSTEVPSVFITHQLMVKCPAALSFLEPILYKFNLQTIKNYSHFWIPDIEEKQNLSGDLSHKYTAPIHTRFIGALSRFKPTESDIKNAYDIVVILSGPEPQRSILEQEIVEQLGNTSYKALIVQGRPGLDSQPTKAPNIKLVAHLNTVELQAAIESATYIITRPGYSTIMDLAVLNKKAIFIPTPGQTEQEYLAFYYKKEQLFYSENQNNFNLERAIKESLHYRGFTKFKNSSTNLAKVVSTFLTAI